MRHCECEEAPVDGYRYQYPRPAVTVDLMVVTSRFSFADGWPRVLLIRRGKPPYKGYLALPGGFLNMDETGEQGALRELREETGLAEVQTHFLGAFDAVDRDPRGRTISLAHIAVVAGTPIVKGADDAVEASWHPLLQNEVLAFDHDSIVKVGVRWLIDKGFYNFETVGGLL